MLENSTVGSDAELFEEQCKASLELAAPELAGYEVLKLIGEGSYGSVWRARDTATSAIVAIKRFHRQPSDQSCAEVEHLAKLSAARGIVSLWDVHLHSEPYCYVMEYMPGGTIADELRTSSTRPFPQAWAEFRQLIEALCYVHRDGIVHGDIKPDNILLDAAGRPRLCDFGQARGRGTHGRALGTQFYMPPEQARGEGLPDPQWDVYAMGAILYEMLTGQKPRFDSEIAKSLSVPTASSTEARNRLEKYARHLEWHPLADAHRRAPGVDSSVASLIEQCLSFDLQKRPADANAVLRLIDQCEHKRRSKPLFLFGALTPAILSLLLGLAVLLFGRWMLDSIRRSWIDNVQASNLGIAQAIGSSLRDTFNARIEIVRRAVKDPQLPSMIEQRDRAGLADFLTLNYEARQGQIYRWAVFDDQGVQQGNYGRLREVAPEAWDDCEVGSESRTLGQNFSWRGWFNGDQDYDKNLSRINSEGRLKFRRRRGQDAFVAQPYWREGTNGFAVFAIASTIAASEEDRPRGVLLGLFPYNQLIGWVSDFEQSQSADMRNVVIVNDRMQIVYHPELVAMSKLIREWPARLERGEVEGEPPPFEAPPTQADHIRLAFDGESVLDDYIDPLDQHTYLGSSYVTKLDNGQRFAVIVQQQELTAMKPVRALQNLLFGLGWGLLGIGGVFLASNTYALYWFLKTQQDSASHDKTSR